MNEPKGEAVAKEIGGVFCKCNVTSDADVDAAFAKAREAIGQERILINCAGTGNAAKTAGRDRKTGEIKHFPLDAFNMIIQINLVGTFRCIAKSAAGMLTLEPQEDGERGAIVNTASRRGRGRPDGPGRLFGVQGRRGRHDPAHRPRPRQRRHPGQHHPAGHLQHAADERRPAPGEGRARRLRALPQAPRQRRGVRPAGA